MDCSGSNGYKHGFEILMCSFGEEKVSGKLQSGPCRGLLLVNVTTKDVACQVGCPFGGCSLISE